MSDRPDDRPHDAADAQPDAGLGPIEAALTSALEAWAGGPIAEADPSPMTAADDERVAAIEATVATAGVPRRFQILGVAAAAVVVLLVGSLVLTRSDDPEVQSVGGDPTTSSPATTDPRPDLPGTGPGTTTVEGPGTSAPVATTAPAGGGLAGLDARNFTYPTSICTEALGENGPLPGASVTLVDGEATFPPVMDGDRFVSMGYVVAAGDVVYGDVTGDGVDDAVVSLACALAQSDGWWPSVVVISETDGAPTVIASIVTSGFEVTGTGTQDAGEPFTYEWFESVLAVQAVDGHLAIRWNQAEEQLPANRGEQRRTTVTYQWDGVTFLPMSEADVEVIPPTLPPPPPDPVPIDDADFTDVVLPTDRTLSGEGRAVCAMTFRDDHPVDTLLIDGHGVVRNQPGDELGTVDLDHVELANLDGDDLDEALVWFRCTRGATSVLAVSVFEPGTEKPYLLWSTPQANYVWDDVAGVEIRPGQDCVLVVRYGWTRDTNVESKVGFRRTEYTFELVPSGTCPA